MASEIRSSSPGTSSRHRRATPGMRMALRVWEIPTRRGPAGWLARSAKVWRMALSRARNRWQ